MMQTIAQMLQGTALDLAAVAEPAETTMIEALASTRVSAAAAHVSGSAHAHALVHDRGAGGVHRDVLVAFASPSELDVLASVWKLLATLMMGHTSSEGLLSTRRSGTARVQHHAIPTCGRRLPNGRPG